MKRLFVNLDLCIGCLSCEQACARTHAGRTALPFGGIKAVALVPSVCRQCEEAPCLEACPVAALVKREDGAVVRRELECTNCGSCVLACPFGALGWGAEPGLVGAKCDNCEARLAKGLEPACVATCPTGARIFVEVTEVLEGAHGVMLDAASLGLGEGPRRKPAAESPERES